MNIDMMNRTVLTLGIMMFGLCLILIPVLNKNSAEYVITVVTLWINILLLIYVVLKLRFEKKKSLKK